MNLNDQITKIMELLSKKDTYCFTFKTSLIVSHLKYLDEYYASWMVKFDYDLTLPNGWSVNGRHRQLFGQIFAVKC